MFDLKRFKRCGVDVRIADNVVIKYPENIEIGDHVAIDNFVVISTSLSLGAYVHIASCVSIIGGKPSKCIMEDFSFISCGGRVICGSDKISGMIGPAIPPEVRDFYQREIVIGRAAGLFSNSVAVASLGEGSILGANSFLLHDSEPWKVYVGNPAKVIKQRELSVVARNFMETYK